MVFATFTKTKSVKCSIALAIAWHTLELKSRRNCSSSVAVETLLADLPLDSVRMVLRWDCIFCWTLRRQQLNPAAWLHITEDSGRPFPLPEILLRYGPRQGWVRGDASLSGYSQVGAIQSGRTRTPGLKRVRTVLLYFSMQIIPF